MIAHVASYSVPLAIYEAAWLRALHIVIIATVAANSISITFGGNEAYVETQSHFKCYTLTRSAGVVGACILND